MQIAASEQLVSDEREKVFGNKPPWLRFSSNYFFGPRLALSGDRALKSGFPSNALTKLRCSSTFPSCAKEGTFAIGLGPRALGHRSRRGTASIIGYIGHVEQETFLGLSFALLPAPALSPHSFF